MSASRFAHFLQIAPRFCFPIGWRDSLLDALYPPRCTGCGRLGHAVFCFDCAPNVHPLYAPFCGICSEPFQKETFNAPICARCRANTPHFTAARSTFLYAGPLRDAIHRFKYDQKTSYAQRLAPLLWEKMRTDPILNAQNFAALVPVPLHRKRQQSRGFNQSVLLARELGKLGGWPVQNALSRTRKTPPQVGLSARERQENVKGAFQIVGDTGKVRGQTLLLIDDVFTTGATLGECAKILKKAGAREVFALTLARQNAPHLPDPPPRRIEWFAF